MADVPKDDPSDHRDPTLFHAPPPPINQHPLFAGNASVGLITADAPRFPTVEEGNHALKAHLNQLGLKYEETHGSYGGPENSFIVYHPTREQMFKLGKHFGQEAVVFSQDGRHELLYTHGPNEGKYHPSLPTIHYNPHQPFDDFYTEIPKLGYLRLHFDFDKVLDSPVKTTMPAPQQGVGQRNVTKAEIARGLIETLRKAVAPRHLPHPHAYAWHEGHSRHHFRSVGHGILVSADHFSAPALQKKEEAQLQTPSTTQAHPHTWSPKAPEPTSVVHPTNDQAIGKGAPLYAKYAAPYGHVDPSAPSNLLHYPMHGKGQAVDKLVADHGYSVYYAGGKHGRPDLANRNYNSKHLMIYDPTAGSGGDFGHTEYTDAWRKVHELAHAISYGELNNIYGEGRRIGALGKQRTLREALRAVHWEWLAAHKQRELAAQVGVHISDEHFHKELNTVMHDAVHRAITGKFTEPSEEGFRPHSHKVPLETALGMVREAAHTIGLQGAHDLVKKHEQSGVTRQEIAQGLAQALREVLAKRCP